MLSMIQRGLGLFTLSWEVFVTEVAANTTQRRWKAWEMMLVL